MKKTVVHIGIRIFAALGLIFTGLFTACSTGESRTKVSAGWNLGNQLECFVQGSSDGKITSAYDESGNLRNAADLTSAQLAAGYETLWGMPLINKNLIQSVKQQGFDAVRLPVTWSPHIDSEGNIDSGWLDRVEEIVDLILDENLECILNVHHDTNHLKYIAADYSNIDLYKNRLAGLWTQIGSRFKDKPENLIFEGFNEILNADSNWDPVWNDSDKSYSAVNELNQVFVTTVRNLGGNNSERRLICNAYAANITEGNLANFRLPEDTVQGKLIVQYHNYSHDIESIKTKFRMLKETCTDKGIPVILGECGIMGTEQTDEITRSVYARWIADEAYRCGIKLFWWDDGNTNYTADTICNHALFSRRTADSRYGVCYFPEVCRILTER